jgi:uncharacterized protein (DUF427 family)
MRAIWNGKVLAESDDTVVVEGNHYFPRDSLVREHFVESDTHTVCPWKGTVSYFSVVVDGRTNTDPAWYYPTTKSAAAQIQGRVAFLARRVGHEWIAAKVANDIFALLLVASQTSMASRDLAAAQACDRGPR